jgi:hypothetical protein
VPGGQVIGRTDKDGGYVIDGACLPEDVAATIYDKLGINRHQPLYTPQDRPVFLAHQGKAMAELFLMWE